jgi:23S rRNA-/tRNA-specific pseudouridylate synthase
MIRYETPEYYFVRKPHGIPSTFGEQYSFLEQIAQEKPPFFAALQQHFSKEQEYGLLNRLDNDTAGLLYFAKTPEIKQKYKDAQAEKKLSKIYMCDVVGEMSVSYPIYGARADKSQSAIM